ncbi:MAG: hypothetical protein HOO93_17295 [Methyloglobulus sp.]|nr:hypothetical protein [Methyloglobulus sp.]
MLRAGEIKGTISDQFRDVGQLVQQRPQVLSPFAAVLAVPGASQALAVGTVASGEMPLPSVKFNNLAPNDPIGYANTFSANKIIQQEYSGKLNYVVNTDSKLILGKSPHISLSGGADVFAAGEAKFVNGQLKYINNDSGHYKPSGATAETSATNAFSNAGFNSLNKYFEKH